jgi:hypothetical protein
MGDHNVICDRTGFKIKASNSRKEWNGLRVREQSWEPRHPQDKITSVVDNQSVYDPRPDSPSRFLEVNQIQPSDL